MSEPQLCPQCGSEIPSGAPAGLCPKCLMIAGLESRPAADPGNAATQPPPSSASSGFVPPTVEEVATRFPQLDILELLGRGGMGAVYKARQRELDRLVAVKILPPEVSRDPAFAERFTREARALARLNHPNIVGVYDFGKTPSLPSPSGRGAGGEGSTGGLFYFIMEFVDGVNLRQAIQAGGMDPKQALAIVPQICDALQFAHDEGVVHRDIKPENILIDKRGRVKIADFGLAKLLGQESVDHGLTATQQVMGTLRYMAPEQMEGTKTVDHRADIYSLGVVFYELLTGELPIGRFAPPSKMVEIDVRLDEVVLRALEKKPEQRYQHASEVKTDIETVSLTSPAYPAATSSRSPRTRFRDLPDDLRRAVRKKLWLAAAACLICLLAGAAAIAVFWTERYTEEVKLTFQPKSKAFKTLVLESEFHGTKARIGSVHPDASGVILRVDVTGERAVSTLTGPPGEFSQRIRDFLPQLKSSGKSSLDREEWLSWLAPTVNTNDPAVQMEAYEFVTLLRQLDIRPPSSAVEFTAACKDALTDYSLASTSGGFSAPNFGEQKTVLIALCLALAAIFLIIAWRTRIGALLAFHSTAMPDRPPTAADQIRSGPAGLATAVPNSASDALSDRRFVAVVAVSLIAAWVALLICTNGDKLPFDLRTNPPTIIGIHLLFPLVVAVLAGGAFALIWPRPSEPFLDRIARIAPMLLGCHLLMFSIAMFTCGYDSLEWDRVTFATPNVGVAELHPREEIAYQVGPWKSWVGALAAVTAGVGLLALLLTLGTPPRLRARADVLVLVGLITLGAVAEYMALRPPRTITFTREQYRAFDPDHADGFMNYDRFVREADADFESLRSMPYNPIANPRLLNGDYYSRVKDEHSKVIVHHYFQDEIAWFLLPGGLLLLCGLLTWRQAAAAEEPAAGPRLAPLAATGAFVGVAGPLVCVPGLIVAFAMLDQKEYLWGNAPSMAFMIGLVGMLVWMGISLLAMSVLGASAIGQIRRSGGKFYGLRLALLEALFCPAIALYCTAFVVLACTSMAPSPLLFADLVIVILTVALIYWRLWKKLTRPAADAKANDPDKPRPVVAPGRPNTANPIGRVSLWTSIAGLVLPIVLAMIGSMLASVLRLPSAYFLLCGALLFVLELAALVCGIVGWRTASGKAGVIISAISLVLAGFVVLWLTPVHQMADTPSVTVTEPHVVPTTRELDTTLAVNPFGLHPGKQVPTTPAELAHVLAELPKEFTKGLLGSDEQSIRDLDTQVFAIDFDDGPADFWLQVRETGQQTFPVRLPSRNERDAWRIPKAKAHILMWFQPRQSVGMSDRARGALAEKPPGCSLGIDVDGKAVARINYDTPVGGVNQSVPNPFWSDLASKEMRAEDAPYDQDMMSQAIFYVGRKAMARGTITSCRLGLMYRPDRINKKSAQ